MLFPRLWGALCSMCIERRLSICPFIGYSLIHTENHERERLNEFHHKYKGKRRLYSHVFQVTQGHSLRD